MRNRRRTLFSTLGVAGLLTMAIVLSSALPPIRKVTIATGTQGGTYYPIGQEFARILTELPGRPIRSANALLTSGSGDNVTKLIAGQADLGFVMMPAVVETPAAREHLRMLARLYTDVVQIVVRKGAGIEQLSHLQGKRVYLGKPGSATRLVALALTRSHPPVDDKAWRALSFREAVDALKAAEIDAAILVAGTPTEAVIEGLASGECTLLSMRDVDRDSLTRKERNKYAFSPVTISAGLYPHLEEDVHTLGLDVFLVCRRDLGEEHASLIVRALFDNAPDLLMAHTRAGDILFSHAFKVDGSLLSLHPGAVRFKDKDTLLIATGTLNGKYYTLGRMIQELLEEKRTPATVIQTRGSLENATLLGAGEDPATATKPRLAIMQYDIALLSRFTLPESVYGVDPFSLVADDPGAPGQLATIKRIATLHSENVHVIARRAVFGNRVATNVTLGDLEAVARERYRSGKPLRVCLGPEKSGTQVVAKALLLHHGVKRSENIVFLHRTAPEMVKQLLSGDLDLGFIVSYVPNRAVKAALNDPELQLVSLDPKARAGIAGPAFDLSVIPARTYACQRANEPDIQTVATRAVLVTTSGVSGIDVGTVARAVFEGEAFIRGKDVEQDMAERLPSLPLHVDAESYYRESGYLPQKASFLSWLANSVTVSWKSLAILVVIVATYKGLLELKRRFTANEIGARVLDISIEASEQLSAQKLRVIRSEIQERVQRTFWQRGELNWGRWRYLHDLIEERITEAKGNLTRSFITEVRAIKGSNGQSTRKKREKLDRIESRLMSSLANGEVEASQRDVVLGIIKEARGQKGA